MKKQPVYLQTPSTYGPTYFRVRPLFGWWLLKWIPVYLILNADKEEAEEWLNRDR